MYKVIINTNYKFNKHIVTMVELFYNDLYPWYLSKI